MITPPTNSPSANCQPSSTQITIPSSITRFVEANMKTIELTKSAPRWKSVLAIADAAYEHEDDAAPNNVARPISRGPRRPSTRSIDTRGTNACTAPEIPKPRIRAQSVAQNMKNASRSECATSMSRWCIA